MVALQVITVYKSQKALSGYDVSYARTFKNARWARAYVGAYHWNGLGAKTHGEGPALTLNVGKSHWLASWYYITTYTTCFSRCRVYIR